MLDRSWVYRVITYSIITILAVVCLVPSVSGWLGKEDRVPSIIRDHFQKKIQLGLDLQGGLHLVYEVQVQKAVSDKADRLSVELEEKLRKEKKVANVKAERTGDDQIKLVFKNPSDISKADNKFLKDYQRYLTESGRDKEKGELTLKIDSDYVDELKEYAVTQGVQTITGRVDKLGVAEPSVNKKGNDIVVELPGLKPEDFEHVKNQIGRTAQLEFKFVDDGTEYMKKLTGIAAGKKTEFPGLEVGYDAWSEKDSGTQHSDVYLRSKDRNEIEKFLATLPKDDQIPSDHEIGYEQMNPREETDDEGNPTPSKKDRMWRTHYLHRRAELTGEYIEDADVGQDSQTFRPEVDLKFDSEGASIFEKISGANIGRKMAIILDDRINSAPVIETRIGGGRARITMGGAGDRLQIMQEAKDLVAVLRSGALPAPLKKTFETQVGPTLGRDAVDKAKLSMEVGSLVVIFFMLLYYRVSGLVADIAMVLNILYQLAILAVMGATLTLPGIAGVVLTVGMAVDANIIIYERIREEIRGGKSARSAVDAGFDRAFWTVVDAHITAFIAGIVLYSYGTGPIRGFAVTLMIGVVANLFTSIWLSRAFFDFLVGRRNVTSLSI